ncbi:hypothetical protein ACQRIU_000021 [Beauveria bassiana]
MATRVPSVGDNFNGARFRAAVEAVIDSTPVLRTRIIELPSRGAVNVVVRQPVSWITKISSEECIDGDEMVMAMEDTGTPLSRCGLVEKDEHGDNYFIWALHPAIHDDISLRQHLREIDQTYSGLERASSLPFQLYVRFCETLDERRAAMFWERKLSGAKAAPFPNVAAGAAAKVLRPDKSLQQYMTGPLELGKDDSVASATVWMAWAMLTARYTDSEEVLFGARVTGRQAAMEDIDRIAGPTTSTVPIWASIDWQSTISEVRQQMQRQAADLVPFAQLGLKKIRQLSAEADKASRFQSLIVFQSAQDVERYSSVVFAPEFEDMGTAGSFPRDNYAVVITCRTLGQKDSALETILLSGERPNSHVLSQWIDKVCIKNAYGPSECTFKSTHAIVSSANLQSPDIGQTFGKHLATTSATTLPFAVELITPRGSQNAMLVVFISVPRTKSDRSMETVAEELTLGLNDKLAQVLPRSMIPGSYVPITELPMGGTGKIDRRRLRQIGSELSREELLATAI